MAKGKKKTAKSKKGAKKTRTVARSSKTGRFVKKGYAKKHPATTEIQRVKSRRKKLKPKRIALRAGIGPPVPGGTHGPGDEP